MERPLGGQDEDEGEGGTPESDGVGTAGSPGLESAGPSGSDLATRVGRLESRQSADRFLLGQLEAEVASLRRNEASSREEAADAQQRRLEAEAYTALMVVERDHIARERDASLLEQQATEQRLQILQAALKNAALERERIERVYQDRMAQLTQAQNEQNAKLQAWEAEIEQLRSHNAALKRESAYLRQTAFTTRPSSGGRRQDQQLLRCFSCKAGYTVPPDRLDNAPAAGGSECAFHPLPSVEPRVWRRWASSQLFGYRQTHGSFHYWPCCNVLAARGRRPEGCRRGRHHQRWEMDVMMKSVMLDRDILEEEGEDDREPTILGASEA